MVVFQLATTSERRKNYSAPCPVGSPGSLLWWDSHLRGLSKSHGGRKRGTGSHSSQCNHTITKEGHHNTKQMDELPGE